jgi:DNA polymerase-3 subunit epsilon
MSRQILLDTETTGLEPGAGHRIIEIGCVEMVGRRLTGNNFHQYLQPDREIDQGAIEVHGITNEFLVGKPRFADVAERLFEYLKGAELIIHNAVFDLGFLNHEFSRLGGDYPRIEDQCLVTDSLSMARKKHPGQRNNLNALCKRYKVDNSRRDFHGALLDASILAEVYLAMTGGQVSLMLGHEDESAHLITQSALTFVSGKRPPLRVIRASAEEEVAHQARLDAIAKASGGKLVWSWPSAGHEGTAE